MNTLAKKSSHQLADFIERTDRSVEIHSNIFVEGSRGSFVLLADGKNITLQFNRLADILSMYQMGKSNVSVEDFNLIHRLLKSSGITLYIKNGFPAVAGANAGKATKWIVRNLILREV